ncbi:MFS transporter [Breznakiella homolactica]|uniref:MFS transporter n=1 Tax=Breznakiella homolactica TaxID=2798577 RepID=A0A7T8B9E5_9SPIR|nr:MFS transporter [Breznakiella homolactica]QQO09544.1 MFS transporter [Breznakiella homolactica]
MAAKKLTVREKLGFGIYDLGGNLFFTALGFWSLNYLTDTVGLAAGLAGLAVMIGKLWDAVTDPVMGYISDRTRSRWGRRRPYLLFGAVPLFLTMWFFFTNPQIENPVLLTLWAALALMLLNTAYTVTNIPYSSLTPELTDDYHERTSLNGYRFGCAVFGTIIGAAAVQPIVDTFPDKSKGFSAAGFILGLIMMAATLITFFGTKEKKHSPKDYPTEGFFSTYKAVFFNKPYVILLITYALNLMGLNFLQGILVYYTKYIYNREDITTIALVILLAVAMVCIPLSVLVSKKIGKKRTYQICFGVLASACAIIFFLGHILGPNFFLGLMVYAGIGVGFGYVAPFSMVPDTIEFDAVKTGARKEGAYYGMWTFVSKAGQALSIFFSGLILSLGGYVADGIQNSGAIMAIRLIIGPFPALVLIAAFILVQFYPIDEKTYQSIIAQNSREES